MRNPWPFLRRQFIFLLGFGASTGAAYLLAGAWWATLRAASGSWFGPATLVLATPALLYALGYTTANLKSLQIWLYLRRNLP
jgi:hypothetical protein